MTEDGFDLAVRDRLDALAAAVPVDPWSTHRAIPTAAVRSGPLGGRIAIGRLGPVFTVAVVAVMVGGLAKVGPFAPGSETTRRVVATSVEGPFELSIRSEKSRYRQHETIDVTASLTYVGGGAVDPVASALYGDGESIVISYVGQGVPLSFYVAERGGDLIMPHGRPYSREQTILARGAPVSKALVLSDAGWYFNNPAAELPVPTTLSAPPEASEGRLPAGTWHVHVLASFEVDGRSHLQFDMDASVAIEVIDNSTPSVPPDANGPQAVTVRDGDFELTLRSDKTRYAPDEPIGIATELTYVGQAPSIRIGHGKGSPMGFGVVEPVNGLEMAPGWLTSCDQSTLDRGVSVQELFRKSGGFDGDDPRASDFEAFYADPAFRLPVGTWHVYVLALFEVNGCGQGEHHSIRAELEITVSPDASPEVTPSDAPGATPLASEQVLVPMPTIDPDAPAGQIQPDGSVLDVSTDGRFELRLEAAQSVYLASAPVVMSASSSFVGPEGSIDVGSWGPLVTFRVDQLDAITPTSSTMIIDYATCTSGTMTRGNPIQAPLLSIYHLTSDNVDTVWANLDLTDSTLRLPAGSWRITAYFRAYLGPSTSGDCPTGTEEPHSLEAAVDIRVVPTSGTDIPLRTAAEPAKACRLALSGGVLAAHPASGLGVSGADGALRAVMWPFGSTARQEAGGAVLVGADGHVIAREGDAIKFTGGLMTNELDGFYACMSVDLVEPSS